MSNRIVILSGAVTKRSEVTAQSKDPALDRRVELASRRSPHAPDRQEGRKKQEQTGEVHRPVPGFLFVSLVFSGLTPLIVEVRTSCPFYCGQKPGPSMALGHSSSPLSKYNLFPSRVITTGMGVPSGKVSDSWTARILLALATNTPAKTEVRIKVPDS